MISKTLLLLATLLGGMVNASPGVDASQVPGKNTPAVTSRDANSSETKSREARRTRVADGFSADEIVIKVQEFYNQAQQLTAFFRQTYTNTTFGTESISNGKVWIKKPGMMRWDYKSKGKRVNKSFISDGTTLWAVEHDNKQVLKKSLERNLLPVAITFLYGKGDLARDFAAKLDMSGTYGKKSDHVLELTPRRPSAQYKMLYLVVDPGNFRVKQSIVVEASGNINHFRFYRPDTKRPVKDSWFLVDEKKLRSYRIVDSGETAGH
ncbi:MAG: outer membrane lipoprotein carrier protein LolA [Proteobacteria bacterium]|nr:outer membrane lipoprotein carrier protein LolA [Pseudomonadota bacterium]